MDSTRINDIVARHGLPGFRAGQLREAFFRQHVSGFAEITTLGKELRARLAAEPVLVLAPAVVRVSRDGRAHKALLRLADDRAVESVLLSPKPGLWSCCISSQVGCALKCSFCATGRMGFTRNLSAEEITDQVLFWRQYIRREGLDARLQNVVYMGMGEPFQNQANVFASLAELTNPETFGLGDRSLSVSTSGLPRGIAALAERFPQVNLALSLHAATDELRTRLMPINRGHPLAELRDALADYLKRTNRKVFIEYVLLAGENDQAEHAAQLAAWLATVAPRHLLHVNLIAFNPTPTPHHAPPPSRAREFRDALAAAGVGVTIRKNLGQDIEGACGQLAALEPAPVGSARFSVSTPSGAAVAGNVEHAKA